MRLETPRLIITKFDSSMAGVVHYNSLDDDNRRFVPDEVFETVEEAAERRGRLYETVPRLDVVFPPGGDPGEFNADEFVLRCREISKALKKVHPESQMWPSAQKPHLVPY